MSDYFERLSRDLSNLGIDESFAYQPSSYLALSSQMKRLCLHLRNPNRLVREKNPELFTALGRSVCRMLDGGHRLFEIKNYQCCSQSEKFLLENLVDDDREKCDQPIILTDDEEPVGILKTVGDATCYGLADDPSLGLMSGAFSAAEGHTDFNPYLLEPGSQPWRLDIGDIDKLYPVRFSVFMVPVAARRNLTAGDADTAAVLRTSHSHIAARAAELLASTRPLELQEACT